MYLRLYLYKRKYNKNGTVKKYKARLVALRYGQVSGMHMFNTSAQVEKSATVRMLLAIVFINNMHIHQLDISNAFCCANIEGNVYTVPPPNFDLPSGHFFKLEKSFYGLRSSPRAFIKSLHFTPCTLEPRLHHVSTRVNVYILSFVLMTLSLRVRI